jgi:hypothetical protein
MLDAATPIAGQLSENLDFAGEKLEPAIGLEPMTC